MSQVNRVALISSSFHPYVGGVEEHVRNVAARLQIRGVGVEVWTVDRGEHLGTAKVDGVVVRYLPTPLPSRNARDLVGFAADAPRALGAWLDAQRAFRPDVLNVQCFGPNGLYAQVLAALTRQPLVLSSHGETFMDDHHVFDRSRLFQLGLRRGLRTSAISTACSQFVADDLTVHFGAGAVTIVPNGVDLHEGEGQEAAAPFDAARPTVFAVGRVEHVKGFDLLMRAFQAAGLPPEHQLVIGGDGSELDALRHLSEELGISSMVRFPGRLDRAQVTAGMAAAAVNVVPSRVEAFGIVVLEGWRSGRPLVATNRGGPQTLVTDGVDGVLVAPEDTEAFADALRRVLLDHMWASRLGARGRETVEGYTWDTVVDAYLKVYAEATAVTPKRAHDRERSAPR